MEKLFSYGTLQQKEVQVETFKRTLEGSKDLLMGYKISTVQIKDQRVIELSGSDMHLILEFTGNDSDMVEGSVFKITEAELAHADEYEVDEYQRVSAQLKSGQTAWIYAAAK